MQPDRGAKRPREEDGGASAEDDSRGGKHQKGLSARELARYREVVGSEGEMRDNDELTGDKKKILEKLMDQDEEEPEVSEMWLSVAISLANLCFHTDQTRLEAFHVKDDVLCQLLLAPRILIRRQHVKL